MKLLRLRLIIAKILNPHCEVTVVEFGLDETRRTYLSYRPTK